MNTCPDIVTWVAGMSLGLLASLTSLWLAVGDRRVLNDHILARVADVARRTLGVGMVRRMERNANHAVFTEVMRTLALAGFLYVGVSALLMPPRPCVFNPLTWTLIASGLLVSLNSLHALYTRRGNNFAEGPDDPSDAERDVERDAERDPGRDEGRDLVRDPARDEAHDREQASG